MRMNGVTLLFSITVPWGLGNRSTAKDPFGAPHLVLPIDGTGHTVIHLRQGLCLQWGSLFNHLHYNKGEHCIGPPPIHSKIGTKSDAKKNRKSSRRLLFFFLLNLSHSTLQQKKQKVSPPFFFITSLKILPLLLATA